MSLLPRHRWRWGEDSLLPFAAKLTTADGIATPKPIRITELLGIGAVQ